MKKTTTYLLALVAFFALNGTLKAQSDAEAATTAAPAVEKAPVAAMTFEETTHDFGDMEQNGDASTEFKFTNTSDVPLKITFAKGSCGCTVPQWPREEIAPGESGVIRVKYDSKRLGPINKNVRVTANTEPETTVLYIKGNIHAKPQPQIVAPASPAPAVKPASGTSTATESGSQK